MQLKLLIALLAPPLLLAAGLAQAASGAVVGTQPQESTHAHQGHAGHHAPVAAAEIAADHIPWETDAPLREGMRRMRDALDRIDHDGSEQLDQAQVLTLANEVDQAAAFMFAHCQLAAAPDVALHGLLARLMAGAQALRKDPHETAALVPMRAALADYPRLFADPAFAAGKPANGGD